MIRGDRAGAVTRENPLTPPLSHKRGEDLRETHFRALAGEGEATSFDFRSAGFLWLE